MIRALLSQIFSRYQQSMLADLVPATAVMCGGLWLTALVMGI